VKLFIPGPISVEKETLGTMQKEMISHRSDAFQELMKNCEEGLQKVFQTQNPVIISTSSGSGLMEGAIRNCVSENVLVCSCGAFGKKWAQIAESCGKKVEILKVEDGKAIHADELKKAMEGKNFEAVCITHNETSTGIQNNLEELVGIVKENGALLLVDCVSSMGGVDINVDKIGIDVCVTSSQKCFALPPGLAFASVSKNVQEKTKTVKGRGYYFDFVELIKNLEKNETPYTPAITFFYTLEEKIKDIEKEGLEKRFERHKKMALMAQDWAIKNGFELFAEKGYESNTVTCITNTKKIDFKTVKKEMQKKGYFIDTGYRKLNGVLVEKGKNETFRIPHMGELKINEFEEFLKNLEETINEITK